MRAVLSGASAAGFFVVALHFGRFWTESRDRLFLLFAAAFGLLGVNSAVLGLTTPQGEFDIVVYGIRLAAFLLILYAIYDKNRR